MKKVCLPVRFIPKETCGCVIECICMQEDEAVDIGPKRTRKKFYYMDFNHVEFGDQLNDLELLTREKLLTRHVWERMVFWLDLEEALKTLTRYQRECFVLNFIEGYTDREIAALRGSAHSTVCRHITAAVKKIRNFMEDGYQKPPKGSYIYRGT